MTKPARSNRVLVRLILCASLVSAGRAQVFTTLAAFDGGNGANPIASPIQGLNGNLYGTTAGGGANNAGAVYEITLPGQLTTLYSFCSQINCSDGKLPVAALLLANNGNFYGTTSQGGANNGGTVFEITPAGKLTTLYSFCSQPNCSDGQSPQAGLAQSINGAFYSTTAAGGVNGFGTVFKVTSAGRLTTLHSFCSAPGCSDGQQPTAGLLQGAGGDFYGTTSYGGGYGEKGTVFKISPTGELTTLHDFCPASDCGGQPFAGLAQGINGNLYGTTSDGGTRCRNSGGCGTIYETTPDGNLTTLYNLCSQPDCADGAGPVAGLAQATDDNFYGTTEEGGANGDGTVYEMTASGQLTTLYSFCTQPNCADGYSSAAALLQATNGYLYGTAAGGGNPVCTGGCGTVFSLSVGLAPFVKTLPAAGKTGGEVGILGNNLTGATSVTFNGVSAQFTVRSSTLIVTHVPNGAATGTVQVTLPNGTLSSNAPFYVLK